MMALLFGLNLAASPPTGEKRELRVTRRPAIFKC
jgi:hypothetical protein